MIGNQIIQEMYPWVYFLFSMSPPTVYSVFTIADIISGMVRKFEKNTYYRPFRDPFDRSKRFKCLKTIYSLDG